MEESKKVAPEPEKFYSCDIDASVWTRTCPKEALIDLLEEVDEVVDEVPKVHVAWVDLEKVLDWAVEAIDECDWRMEHGEAPKLDFGSIKDALRGVLSESDFGFTTYEEYDGGGLEEIVEKHNQNVGFRKLDKFLAKVPDFSGEDLVNAQKASEIARRLWGRLRDCPEPLVSWANNGSVLFTWGSRKRKFWLELTFDPASYQQTGIEYFMDGMRDVDVEVTEDKAEVRVRQALLMMEAAKVVKERDNECNECVEEFGNASVRLFFDCVVVLDDEVGAGYELNVRNVMRTLERVCQGLSVELTVEKTIRDTYRVAMKDGFAVCQFSVSGVKYKLGLWRRDS